MICAEFWEQVAKLSDIASTIMRFFMKRCNDVFKIILYILYRWYQEMRDRHPRGSVDEGVSVLYRSDSLPTAMPSILRQSPFDAQADCVHCLKLCK